MRIISGFLLVFLILLLTISPAMAAGMSVATSPIALLNGNFTLSCELNTSEKNSMYAYLLRSPGNFLMEFDLGYRWYIGKAQNGFNGELAGGYLLITDVGEVFLKPEDSGLIFTGIVGYKKTFKWGLTLDGGFGIVLAPWARYPLGMAMITDVGYGW